MFEYAGTLFPAMRIGPTSVYLSLYLYLCGNHRIIY